MVLTEVCGMKSFDVLDSKFFGDGLMEKKVQETEHCTHIYQRPALKPLAVWVHDVPLNSDFALQSLSVLISTKFKKV